MGFGQAVKMGNKLQMIASFTIVNWLVGFVGIGQIGGYLNYFLPGFNGLRAASPCAMQLFRQHVRLTASLAIASAALLWATSNAYSYEKSQSKYFPAPTTDSLAWLRPFRVLQDLTTVKSTGANQTCSILLAPTCWS